MVLSQGIIGYTGDTRAVLDARHQRRNHE
jgi:hypothetical protein